MIQMMMQMQSNMMQMLRSTSDSNRNNDLIAYMREKDELDRKHQDERDANMLTTMQHLASSLSQSRNDETTYDSPNTIHIHNDDDHDDPKDWKVFEYVGRMR